jgi:hypothetical protein
MYHPRAKSLLVALSVLITASEVNAQTTTVSNPTNGRDNNPYSKYGIGELLNSNNAVLRGMGNITSAYESPVAVNSDNPASYSFLKRTTFEAAFMGRTRHIVSGNQSYNSGTGTISYLHIGFPIGKGGGLVFGYKPYSTAYYSLIDSTSSTLLGKTYKTYNGQGELNDAYVGAAAKFKGLSLGFNLGYRFGNINSTTTVQDSSFTNHAFRAEFSNYNRIGGLYWKGGLMYKRVIDSNLIFRIGGTLALNQNLSETFRTYQIAGYNFGDTVVRDTSYNPGTVRGTLTLPLSYSVGIMIGRTEKWSVGVDYTATQWSSFSSTPDASLNSGVGEQAYKISIGGELTPDATALRNYLSRVTYRVGGYYGTDYLKLNNTVLPCYGITFGASFPFRRSLSQVHTAFDIGKLGTTENNLMSQTYVRFTVGISFNDLWFVKTKYN